MASIITEKGSDVIIRICSTATEVENDILIDGTIKLPDKDSFNIYSGLTIPADIKAKTFCYNPEKNFFINKRFLYASGEDSINVSIPDVQTEINNPKVILADEHTGNKNYTLQSVGKSISIINDGEQSLNLSINSMDIKVDTGESFSDLFEDFSSFNITASGPYRLVVRG